MIAMIEKTIVKQLLHDTIHEAMNEIVEAGDYMYDEDKNGHITGIIPSYYKFKSENLHDIENYVNNAEHLVDNGIMNAGTIITTFLPYMYDYPLINRQDLNDAIDFTADMIRKIDDNVEKQ